MVILRSGALQDTALDVGVTAGIRQLGLHERTGPYPDFARAAALQPEALARHFGELWGMTTFTYDPATKTYTGTTGTDTLEFNTTAADLTSATLTSVEVLTANLAKATTFTVDAGDLAELQSITGNGGSDTLVVKASKADLGAISLNSIESLKIVSATGSEITLKEPAGLQSITGTAKTDTLSFVTTQVDLSSTTLSGIEVIKAASANATTFTLDQTDLAAKGSVIGSADGTDAITVAGTSLDLTGTTVQGIELLNANPGKATTLTITAAELAAFGQISGSSESDTLVVVGTAIDLTLHPLDSIETVRAGSAGANIFTVSDSVLASGIATITGGAGIDTIQVDGFVDLSNTSLNSIERLQVVPNNAPVEFVLDQNDLAKGGSIIGASGNGDTLTAATNALDLSGTTLTNIEFIGTKFAGGTTFTVTGTQLSSLDFTGGTGKDTLVVKSALIDVTTAKLHSIEALDAGLATATTFRINASQLANQGGKIATLSGSSGSDTLIVVGSDVNLAGTLTLDSIEILRADASLGKTGTVFALEQDNLAGNGSVIGNAAASDSIVVQDSRLDLSSTTLTSIESLKAGTTQGTTFIVDQQDLAENGSVIGSSGSDALVAQGLSLDLTSTNLSSIEVLAAGQNKATTFTLDGDNLPGLTAIEGSTGTDTLVVKASTIDLSTITLNSIEALKVVAAGPATISLDGLGSLTSITGTAKTDTLTFSATTLDFSSTTLSSIEVISAATASAAVTFTLDQADLASNGSIIGSGVGGNTIVAAGTSLDLSSTTLQDIQTLEVGTGKGTTLTITAAQALSLGAVLGGAGSDTLVVKGTDINLGNLTPIDSIETVKAGQATATTFTIGSNQLASVNAGGIASIIGGAGVDTLVSDGTVDLSKTSLTSIERLQAANGTPFVEFVVDQADLAKGGSVIGSTSTSDQITAAGSVLDISSTTLTSVEQLGTLFAGGTILTVTDKQFAGLTAITGSGGFDTVSVKGTVIDISSTAPGSIPSLSFIDGLQAGLAAATTFRVDLLQLANQGGEIASLTGSSGIDTLTVIGSNFNLSGALTLDNIEILRADAKLGTTGTVFTLQDGDLANKGSVIGNTGASDSILVQGTALDISSTTLTSIESMTTVNGTGTKFTVTAAQFAALPITGGSGKDTLAIRGSLLDLTSSTLNSIEGLATAASTGTTFKVDLADLVTGGSVTGSAGVDTLIVKGTAFDLSHTSVTGVEKFVADATVGTAGTTFSLNQNDITGGGSIIGNAKALTDTLLLSDSGINLYNTTLTSIEILKAGTTNATYFQLDQADLLKGMSIEGSSSKSDTLRTQGTILDLTSVTLTSIEVLESTASKGTTFTVDLGDLAANGTVAGSTASGDTLIVTGTSFDMSSTSLTGIEILKAGGTGVTFTLDQKDLASGGSLIGGAGVDTIKGTGDTLDLSSTTLSGIETLQAGVDGTHFTLNRGDAVKSINGGAGNDEVTFAKGTLVDLTSTTLTSIETIDTSQTGGTTFKVDQADLGRFYSGGASTDILMIHGTSMDLTGSSISSIGTLTTDSALGTTFRVTEDILGNLTGPATVQGSIKGVDTLTIVGTEAYLTSTTLSSIERITIENTGNSPMILHMTDTQLTGLGSAGVITGPAVANLNRLEIITGDMDLTKIALSGFQRLVLDSSGSIMVDQADITSLGVGGLVSGSGSTLVIHGTALDLTSTTLNSIVTIATDSAKGTTFTVDQADLANGGSVIGGAGTDTLVAKGASLDLSNTSLTSIEVLKAGSTAATTFTLDADDLGKLGSVVGNLGQDKLVIVGAATQISLANLTLTSIETIETSSATAGTIFTVSGKDGGVTLDLTASGFSDTIEFSGYKVTSVTNDAAILAHTLTLKGFGGADIMDVGAIATHGLPSQSTAISVGSASTLKAALNLAAATDVGATSAIVTFEYGGDTYVLVDNSASKTLTADDAVIKLVGTGHALGDFNFGL
jgi:hypothetical protein